MDKIAEDKMALSMKLFYLKDTFNGLKKKVEFKLTESAVTLKSFFDIEIPPLLISDSTFLNQILLNLLTNTAKFTIDGSIEFYARIISKSSQILLVEFTIRDTGIGIDDKKIKSIFDRLL